MWFSALAMLQELYGNVLVPVPHGLLRDRLTRLDAETVITAPWTVLVALGVGVPFHH